ncbi:F-box only protein 42 [Frankliniella fusca]|uniref:F-box only protein 42 n=1 Tax=Frankliniella fusca TaxID=407009 RepID=A0AAE1HH31_9NEOP|nr:F-box only protein 42 [Frankliniella fusca]
MEVEFEDMSEDDSRKSINELPDEVLEYIFSLVSPYKDLKECMLVSKRWHEIVKNVVRLLTLKLTNAINNMDVAWQTITPVEMAPSISKRYSHSACYHENSMYVFGGCTSTSTTFNDLWRLDLNKRQWVRPLTMGTYPSPKSCATMVQYKDALIVFGGWTLPSPFPLHQAWRLFNELHIYSIVKNRWMCINTAFSPPGMAGHSASVHGDTMVIFGGLKAEAHGQYASSNDVWCFDLEAQEWHKQATSDVKPHARYGQSQIWLGKDHLLIIGGCGGPNMVFNDVWLLSLSGKVWVWREVEVQNREWSANYMWCHRACRVGNKVVMMSRDPRPLKRKTQNGVKSKPRSRISSVWVPPRYEESASNMPQRSTSAYQIDRDFNVNGQRGTFSRGNTRMSNGPSRNEHLSGPDSESRPGTSGLNGVKRSKNTDTPGGPHMECEPGPSGLNSQLQTGIGSECQPGPSGISKGASTSRNSVSIPAKTDSADNLSSPGPSSHNWDRLRPTNHSPNRESANRVGSIVLAAFQDREQPARPSPSRARERQLQALQRFEERMRFNNQPRVPEPSNSDDAPVKLQRTMVVCVMDITKVLEEECSARWLALNPETSSSGPEETLLYTLVAGRGELIMFGGIHREAMTLMTNSQINSASNLSNSLHFISAPHGVI